MKALEFLRKKGLVAEDKTKWIVRYSDGTEIDFVELMDEHSADKFSVEEFKNYLHLQDSFGDAVYNCKSENIIKANQPAEEEENENP